MTVSHKNTATIGDFANTWPFLSKLSLYYGPLDITLPSVYTKFLGLKEFLEYQDFVNKVDFLDRDGDVDVQAHADESLPVPKRCYYSASMYMPNFKIDTNLMLKVQDIEIPDELLNKPVVIDRTFNNILRNHNLFNSDKYHWLDFSKPLSYNINICLKTQMPIYCTFTGLPIILDLFNVKQTLIWFDDVPGKQAYDWHYFPDRNTKLVYYKDFINDFKHITV